ncbi:MAG: hypothetical protein HC887_05435 [Desulfobacteraceae bacterium]|nr:hypothetical protein [Desulfobacteraceae bacterium]
MLDEIYKKVKNFIIKVIIVFIIMGMYWSMHFFSPETQKRSLFETMVEYGDYNKVKQMLSEDKSLIKNTYPLLFRAIRSSRKDVAELLIDYGADVNKKAEGRYNPTPLIYATVIQNIDMMGFLLTKGAHVDLSDSLGRTALIYAAEEDFIRGTELLLDNGAKINYMARDMRTALERAIYLNNYKSVRFLFSKGALIDKRVVQSKKYELERTVENNTDLSANIKEIYVNMIQILQEYDDKSN